MAQNYVNKGLNLTYTIPSATTIASGEMVAVGAGSADDKIVGVALGSGTAGDQIEIRVEGVFIVEKTTGQAMTQGQMLYYNGTTGKATTSADDGGTPAVAYPKLGYCWDSELAAATTVKVKLLG